MKRMQFSNASTGLFAHVRIPVLTLLLLFMGSSLIYSKGNFKEQAEKEKANTTAEQVSGQV